MARRAGIDARVDQRFVERDVGPWEGLTVAEIAIVPAERFNLVDPVDDPVDGGLSDGAQSL